MKVVRSTVSFLHSLAPLLGPLSGSGGYAQHGRQRRGVIGAGRMVRVEDWARPEAARVMESRYSVETT